MFNSGEVKAFRRTAKAAATARPAPGCMWTSSGSASCGVSSCQFVSARFPEYEAPGNHPTKVVDNVSKPSDVRSEPKFVLKTSTQVLTVVRRSGLNLDSIDVDEQEVTLWWNKSHTSRIHREATLEAVVGAIMEEQSNA